MPHRAAACSVILCIYLDVRELRLAEVPQNSILLEEALVDCGCMKCPQCLRRKGRCFPIERASPSTKGGCLMKKVLLVFAVSAVLLLLLASAAFAQNYGGGAMNASPTATASATASSFASATATASPTATATATATASATASATSTVSPLLKSGGPP